MDFRIIFNCVWNPLDNAPTGAVLFRHFLPARWTLALSMVPRSGYFFASAENGEESLDTPPPGALLFRHFLPVRLGFGLVQGSLGGVLFCG